MKSHYRQESTTIIHSNQAKDGSRKRNALVELCYRLEDSHRLAKPLNIKVSVTIVEEEGARWRKTAASIKKSAWDWLDAYFDGACLDGDATNVFTDVWETPVQSTLSPKDEADLQRELHQIRLDCAA